MNKFFFLAWLLLPLFAIAQMPVREEPRHKPVFENPYLRVLDARLVPGDTTFYHAHELPSIYTAINLVKLTGQVWGREPGPWVPPVPGQIWYVDHTKTPVTHRLWNIDTASLRILDTEILGSTGGNPRPVEQIAGVQLLVDNEKVRAYSIEIPAKQKIVLPWQAGPALAISLSHGARIRTSGRTSSGGRCFQEQGDFIWLEGKRRAMEFRNSGMETVRLAFYQWK